MTLSFTVFYQLLTLSFSCVLIPHKCCSSNVWSKKRAETQSLGSYCVSRYKSKMHNLHIIVVPCPTWRSKLGRNSKASVFGREELNAYIELFIQYIFRWSRVSLSKLTFHLERAQVGSCLWHPHGISHKKIYPWLDSPLSLFPAGLLFHGWQHVQGLEFPCMPTAVGWDSHTCPQPQDRIPSHAHSPNLSWCAPASHVQTHGMLKAGFNLWVFSN